MKKVLLATTALCAFAGAAAAEVAVTGFAEMGVTSKNYNGEPESKTQFHNGYQIGFKMSGETDTGLAFGATYRLDADATSEENQNPVGDNGTAWISGAFGKLTLGDTDGALDWALTETAMGTSITDDHTTHAGYSGNSDSYYDDQVLRYEYSMGDLGLAASLEQDDGNDRVTGEKVGSEMVGLGLKYKTSAGGVDLGFGLGYQTGESTKLGTDIDGNAADLDVIGVSASAGVAGFTAIVNYVSYDSGLDDADYTYQSLGLGYEVGALLVAANMGYFDADNGSGSNGYGLVVNYDLGGGAILAAGYGSDVDGDTAGNQDQWSIGLSMSF